jgi:hypothetical protein
VAEGVDHARRGVPESSGGCRHSRRRAKPRQAEHTPRVAAGSRPSGRAGPRTVGALRQSATRLARGTGRAGRARAKESGGARPVRQDAIQGPPDLAPSEDHAAGSAVAVYGPREIHSHCDAFVAALAAASTGSRWRVAIAWTAQRRLHRTWTRLEARSKRRTIIAVAAARELVGFCWAITQIE